MTRLLSELIIQARIHGIPGETLIAHARSCGVEPYLMREVAEGRISARDLGLPDLPERLESFKTTQTARLMLWKQSLRQVLSALDMPIIVLKGAPLGNRLTGSPLWRETSDIDLWVSPDRWRQAVQTLETLGYVAPGMPPAETTNQILLTHAVCVPVEIHWNLAPLPWQVPTFEEALSAAVSADYQGIPIVLLNDGMLYLHLLVHAHQHYFALKTLLDFELGRQTVSSDPQLTARYGLVRLDRFMQKLCECMHTAPYRTRQLTPLAAQLWYQNILASQGRGELVFGRESKAVAALGVCIRAASMGLLDGVTRPARAFWQVVLAGPHRVGRFNQRHFPSLYNFVTGYSF